MKSELISHHSWDSLFASLSRRPYFFCLHSSDATSPHSRFSFMGFDPIEIIENGSLDTIQKTHKKYTQKYPDDRFPFMGGAVGFFGYEYASQFPDFPFLKPTADFPQSIVGFYSQVIVWDHQKNQIWHVHDGTPLPTISPQSVALAVLRNRRHSWSKNTYVAAIEKIKQAIFEGEIYQANLSQRFEADYSGDPADLYRQLCQFSPAPFSAYLKCGNRFIASVSPERFFQVSGRDVTSMPIKGTRSRGKTPEDDRHQKEVLLRSEKDQAELMMIVDLVRHDLGKICEFGSISTDPLREIESYAQVHHAVSTIRGKLKDEQDAWDVMRALFPGGSVTGAPKIRAMQILSELETVPRNVYTGAIGYVGFNGNADFNIAIRTVYGQNGHCLWHAGGGIVADSDPEQEYAESLVKASSILGGL